MSELCAALSNAGDYEVVLVDDGSQDATLQVMRQARDRHGRHVRILQHESNRGQSASICTGMRAAHGRLIATMMVMGRASPRIILRLAQEYRVRTPLAVAMIAGERRVRRYSYLRRLSSRIANRVDALLHDGVADTGCGLKVMARDTFLVLPAFDHMHRFLPALVRVTGASVYSVPVAHRPRSAGRSKYGVWNRVWVGIVDLFGVMWLSQRQVDPHAGWHEV